MRVSNLNGPLGAMPREQKRSCDRESCDKVVVLVVVLTPQGPTGRHVASRPGCRPPVPRSSSNHVVYTMNASHRASTSDVIQVMYMQVINGEYRISSFKALAQARCVKLDSPFNAFHPPLGHVVGGKYDLEFQCVCVHGLMKLTNSGNSDALCAVELGGARGALRERLCLFCGRALPDADDDQVKRYARNLEALSCSFRCEQKHDRVDGMATHDVRDPIVSVRLSHLEGYTEDDCSRVQNGRFDDDEHDVCEADLSTVCTRAWWKNALGPFVDSPEPYNDTTCVNVCENVIEVVRDR